MKFRVVVVDTLGRMSGSGGESSSGHGGIPIVLRYGDRMVRAYIVHATDEYMIVVTEDGRMWKIPLKRGEKPSEVTSSRKLALAVA